MTLALYGKSRRRQGALLAAALLAVLIATIGALSAISPGGATRGGGNNQGGGNEACPDKYPVLVDKFDWSGTAYTHSPGDVTGQQVTILQGTATSVWWESTYPIGAIVVKGGPGAKTILLSPAPAWSGSFNNSGLTNQGGQTPDISNVKFCGNLIPTVTKVPAKGDPVDEPGQVIWTVTVTNPSGTGAIDHAVRIKDENVKVVAGPLYQGVADCTIPDGSSFEQELNSANGVECKMHAGSTISFQVVLKEEPKQTCEPQTFRNSASVLLMAYRPVDEKPNGDKTEDWTEDWKVVADRKSVV